MGCGSYVTQRCLDFRGQRSRIITISPSGDSTVQEIENITRGRGNVECNKQDNKYRGRLSRNLFPVALRSETRGNCWGHLSGGGPEPLADSRRLKLQILCAGYKIY